MTSSRLGRGVRSRAASALAAAMVVGLLAGCSTFSSLFSAEKPKPKELEPIVAPITVRQVWNQGIGIVDEEDEMTTRAMVTVILNIVMYLVRHMLAMISVSDKLCFDHYSCSGGEKVLDGVSVGYFIRRAFRSPRTQGDWD